jgi:hypothetical protein
MVTDTTSEVSKIAVDPIRIFIPPTISIGFVASGEWSPGESDALHLTLRGPHCLYRICRRDRLEDLEANPLAAADGRPVRILPDAMRAADDDG